MCFFSIITVSYILASLTYCGSFYLHEFGHVIFSFSPKFEFSNYVSCSPLPIFSIPQQTIPAIKTALTPFGGTILIIGLALIFVWLTRKKLDRSRWLIPLIFGYHEFIGNFLCGTDNLKGGTLDFCINNPFINFLKIKLWIVPLILWLIFAYWISGFFKKQIEVIRKIN